MMIAPLLPLLLVSASLFDVRDIPLADPAAPVFIAPADADKTADVFVLNGNTLSAYTAAPGAKPSTAVLPEGASGFDIYDIDGDGFSEVIAVCGDAIMSYRLSSGGMTPRADTLFTLRTQLSAPSAQPYPYVLVVPQSDPVSGEDVPALALPCENTFELRQPDGTLITSFPIGSGSVHRISYGSPFSVKWNVTPQAGPGDSIEAEVSRVIAFEPELPADLAPIVAPPVLYRRGGVQPAGGTAGSSAETWPWFPLKTDGTTALRALYTLSAPDYRDIVVCVRQSETEDVDLSGKGIVVGPERRYAGAPCVNQEDVPDFNGDGYTDLLLWHAREPGMSLDSLTRVVLGDAWPVNLTVHLFSPEKNRFEPRPASHVTLDVPVDWFAAMTSSGPLRHLVLRDFDGDGRTDLGCSTGPNQWAAYVFGESGFLSRPNFSRTFDEPVERVQFRANLDGGAATTVALRTQKALHLLRPSKK